MDSLLITLSIIIVNYNSRELLKGCLKSIYDTVEEIDFETIVVDNASTDDSQAMIKYLFPKVIIIENSENRGFAVANNQGIRNAKGKYILLLNPDTRFFENSIKKTIDFAERKSSAGIVGCQLLNADGSWQSSVFGFPSLFGAVMDALFLNKFFPRQSYITNRKIIKIPLIEPQKVDWVMGAYFLIKRNVIKVLGGLDERYFMYSEEMDYCYFAKNNDFETWYYPLTSLYHYWEGMSNPSIRSVLWVLISRKLFLLKHYNKNYRVLIEAATYVGLFNRVFVYTMLGIIFMRKKYLNNAWIIFSVFVKMISGAKSYDVSKY